MADISRNTTPAWQDPHLKDRGDYTDVCVQLVVAGLVTMIFRV